MVYNSNQLQTFGDKHSIRLSSAGQRIERKRAPCTDDLDATHSSANECVVLVFGCSGRLESLWHLGVEERHGRLMKRIQVGRRLCCWTAYTDTSAACRNGHMLVDQCDGRLDANGVFRVKRAS